VLPGQCRQNRQAQRKHAHASENGTPPKVRLPGNQQHQPGDPQRNDAHIPQDTGPIVAQRETRHPYKAAARRVLLAEREVPVLSPLIAAEIDYFLQRRGGPGGNRTFLRDLAAARYDLSHLELAAYQAIAALNQQYEGLNVGLADLSIVILAARFRTTRILTFDQHHFRIMRPLQGGTFTLLPFDGPRS
jgi:predicted nucleic acid-binding protein